MHAPPHSPAATGEVRPAEPRMGLQISRMWAPGVGTDELFERLAELAESAERAGFGSVYVMDHFYQLPVLGGAKEPVLEAYTLLGALAARTVRVGLGALVSGNTYRNPALLAKIVTSLDTISKGRAILGIGAGWHEVEHHAYGFAFPGVRERLGRLEEALTIVSGMLRGDAPTFDGEYYRVHNAKNVPESLQPRGPRIVVGGNGERRTLRLAARFADESNVFCDRREIGNKRSALDAHCRALDRDPKRVSMSWLGTLLIGRSRDEALRVRDDFLASHGLRWDLLPDAIRSEIAGTLLLGDPDEIVRQIREEVLARGADRIVVTMPAQVYDADALMLAGDTIRAALARPHARNAERSVGW